MSDSDKGALDAGMLEILVCPACHSKLSTIENSEGEILLQCRNRECRRRYPIRKGIPVMLIDEAEELSPDQFDSLGL